MRSTNLLASVSLVLLAMGSSLSDAAPADQSTVSKEPVENPLAAEYRKCDTDGDGILTEVEYLTRVGRELPVLRREFKVFDANRDAKISLEEFLNVPVGQPEDQRGIIPDPVNLLSQAKRVELIERWKSWDKNGDDGLSANEFSTAGLVSHVRGLESSKFDDWDLNRDQQVSRDEVASVLDMAFGVRSPTGELLRSNAGRVLDWRSFLGLNPDAKGKVKRETYIKSMGPGQDPVFWFPAINAPGNELFGVTEFSTSHHRTDPVGMFLTLDADLNGVLTAPELEGIPADWGPPAKRLFEAFDDDHDEAYSLREFQLLPHINLLTGWQTAQDKNNDGKLSLEEFRFMPGPALAALSAEYFRRLDIDHDQFLSLSEWKFHTTHPEAKFHSLDANSDGELSEEEFAAEGSMPANRLRRDFTVFDANKNGRMTRAEFLTLPYWIPEEQRGMPYDPVGSLVEKSLNDLTQHWAAWDRNGDGSLDEKEFELAGVVRKVRGLESTTFRDWDRNSDKQLSRDEVAKFLDSAFGIRTPEGELLRSKSGWIVDWRLFLALKTDDDGFVSKDEYFRALGAMEVAEKEKWLQSTDKNHDGKFNFAEFSTSNHRTDPMQQFLQLDVDLNGKLSAEELEALPADRLPIGNYLIPGFDDDQDGFLSLREFQWTPAINLLVYCQSLQDLNNDGQLKVDEFNFYSGAALSALSAEYFRRFDVDHDQSLSLDEFPFTTNHPSAREIEIRVLFEDDTETTIAIPQYPIICSPEISPDGKWVAVDGWKHGQNNVAAHVLLASLEGDEARDLGIGCIPHWSADGRRIGYSKYGGGVFIRDFEANANDEELIDRQGWAIHFSTDGLKTAYVKQGNNLVIYDLKSGQKEDVFPEGKSPYRYIEHNFCWSPDSQRICFKGHRPDGTIDVGIVSTTGGDPKLRVRLDAKMVQSDFSWLSDRKRIMFPRLPSPGQHTQIYEFDPDGDQSAVRYPRQPKNRNNGGMCWSRDGKTFVFMSTH